MQPSSSEESTTSTTTTATTTTTTADNYNLLSAYDFASDQEFRNGLGIILGHPGHTASDEEVISKDDVVLQAKCFYISRKKNINPPLDFKDYRRWLKEQHETDTELGLKAAKKSVEDKNEPSTSTTATTTTTTTTLEAESKPEPKPKPAKEAEPAYPSSFAHIVELITNNQPIPGIEEIPDTVLSGHDEPSKAAKRRKPWETSTS